MVAPHIKRAMRAKRAAEERKAAATSGDRPWTAAELTAYNLATLPKPSKAKTTARKKAPAKRAAQTKKGDK